MKVVIEIDIPDNTAATEVTNLFREFKWLAKIRGWRALVGLPKFKKALKKPEPTRTPFRWVQ